VRYLGSPESKRCLGGGSTSERSKHEVVAALLSCAAFGEPRHRAVVKLAGPVSARDEQPGKDRILRRSAADRERLSVRAGRRPGRPGVG